MFQRNTVVAVRQVRIGVRGVGVSGYRGRVAARVEDLRFSRSGSIWRGPFVPVAFPTCS